MAVDVAADEAQPMAVDEAQPMAVGEAADETAHAQARAPRDEAVGVAAPDATTEGGDQQNWCDLTA